MNDDRPLWNDEALLSSEGVRRKRPSVLQRIPARLVAAAISAALAGALVLLPFQSPSIVLVSMFAAAIAGAQYAPMALRHSSLVVIPVSVAAYVVSIVLFLAAGLAVDSKQAIAWAPSAFLLSSLFAPFFVVSAILWATIVRSLEDRLFTTDMRDASRAAAGSSDYAVIGAWIVVAVAWTIVSITQL